MRRREFPQRCCRLKCNYFFDELSACRELFEIDWGKASEEELAKIKLFEIELSAETADRLDMRLFDEAYDDLCETDDIAHTAVLARRYFLGGSTAHPIWELVSDRKAVAVCDLSEYLKESKGRQIYDAK